MVIVIKYDGRQQMFHHYWLPLIYKHQECKFFVEGDIEKMIYPKDVPNLHVTKKVNKDNMKKPIMYCNIDQVPTYKTMIDFNNNIFYKVPLKAKSDTKS